MAKPSRTKALRNRKPAVAPAPPKPRRPNYAGTKQVTLRFKLEHLERLERLARRMSDDDGPWGQRFYRGASSNDVIRFAVVRALDELEPMTSPEATAARRKARRRGMA